MISIYYCQQWLEFCKTRHKRFLTPADDNRTVLILCFVIGWMKNNSGPDLTQGQETITQQQLIYNTDC